MTTRSKNANAHPGNILRDAQRVHRTREEINEEKVLKNIQMEAKQKKKAENEAKRARGEANIARLEAAEDAAIANASSAFPRHKQKKSL
jgi:hypothetical protein